MSVKHLVVNANVKGCYFGSPMNREKYVASSSLLVVFDSLLKQNAKASDYSQDANDLLINLKSVFEAWAR